MDNYYAEYGNALMFLVGFLAPFISDLAGNDDDEVAAAEAEIATFYGTEGADDVMAAETDMMTYLLAGDDTFEGTGGSDTAFGGAGDDALLMRQGNDTAHGGLGDDNIDGGFGNDILYGDAGNDTLNGAGNNDLVYGGDGNDTLTGSSGDDILYGDAGDDVLHGHVAGADTAQDGQDFLYGGAGDDTLILSGTDTGEGGAGADSFVIEEMTIEAGETATVSDFTTGEDDLVVQYVPEVDPVTGMPITPIFTSVNYADGIGSTIFQDGEAIVNIDGIADFDVSMITLEPVDP